MPKMSEEDERKAWLLSSWKNVNVTKDVEHCPSWDLVVLGSLRWYWRGEHQLKNKIIDAEIQAAERQHASCSRACAEVSAKLKSLRVELDEGHAVI